jgi:hypothetical protein
MRCGKKPSAPRYVESFRRTLNALKMNAQIDAISSDGVLYVSIGDLPKSGPKASAEKRVSRYETIVAIATWFSLTVNVRFVRRPFRRVYAARSEEPPESERRGYTPPTTKSGHLQALGLTKMPTTKRELDLAWREAAKRHHPDAPNGDEAKFIAAKRAYNVLSSML